jgi:hypothetical protein
MIKQVAAGIAVYTVVLGPLALLLFGLEAMGGILVGGALTYFNILWISSLVKRLLEGEASSRGLLAVKFGLKQLLLFAIVGVLVALELVAVIPFLIGLSSLVVSVFIVGISWHREFLKPSADDDPESLSG